MQLKKLQTWNIQPFFLAVVATSEKTGGRKQQQKNPSGLMERQPAPEEPNPTQSEISYGYVGCIWDEDWANPSPPLPIIRNENR